MADPFLGEVRAFGFNYAPRLWTQCLGQLMSINQFSSTFAILGTSFGGDGRTTFGAPDLRGRSPMHVGGTGWVSGPGLSPYRLGQQPGVASIALTEEEIPQHRHELHSFFSPGESSTQVAQEQSLLSITSTPDPTAIFAYSKEDTPTQPLDSDSLALAGRSAPHENRQPFLAMNFCLCLDGTFPSRN
ncbi:tail fiber protein [Ferrimonas sp. YFM]|uniref:phage tail protein n=1 Tax=Ferrimonas sp. YFM TaxID=3028878 RepID=UPI0025724B1D|nr:tail fiber protein [Ferrimonas sp. YFM]BDY05998.1 microcystin dependent MdpB family protein [Ferrimonas sp. YFM]